MKLVRCGACGNDVRESDLRAHGETCPAIDLLVSILWRRDRPVVVPVPANELVPNALALQICEARCLRRKFRWN